MTLTFTGAARAGVASTESGATDRLGDAARAKGWRLLRTTRTAASGRGRVPLDRQQGTVETRTGKVRSTRGRDEGALRAATVRRNDYVSLYYRVTTRTPCAGTATVTIRIKTLNDMTKQTLRLGLRKSTPALATLPLHASRGDVPLLRLRVDAAGNTQSVVGRNYLYVK